MVAGSIPCNSKFCVQIQKISVIDIDVLVAHNLKKEVSTVGSLEEPTRWTPTYDPIYEGR